MIDVVDRLLAGGHEPAMATDLKHDVAGHSLSRYARATGQLDDVVELTTYADIEEVLRSTEFEVLTSADRLATDLSAAITGDSLVTLRGTAHFDRRRLESALFRAALMREYEREVIRPRTQEVLARSLTAGGLVPADLKEIAEDVLRFGVGRLVGLDGIETDDGCARFREYYEDLDNAVRIKWARRDPKELVERGKRALQRMTTELIEPAWRRRAELVAREGGDADLPTDLITIMLRNEHHYGQWDADVYAHEIALIITASITTLTNQVCYAFQHIEEWVEQHPEDATRRTDGDFLNACLRESIRLHAGPILFRVAMSDQTLRSGVTIRAGGVVWLNIRAGSSDPSIFGADAREFRPFRERTQGALDHGLMFGVGRHTCIGKRMALGDDPDDVHALNGAGVILLRELYSAGARLDPARDRTFVPELLDVHASLPILFGAC